jgi:tRNA threonylcarbamoyladenosine biosynthesis protein TsaB
VRVLAVDTTTERGSLAVVSEQGVLAEARVRTGAGHSRWLLPTAEAVLHGLGLAASEIDAFAVTTGPGSFTGLRIGLSSVQGLALASARPCVGLSTLDTLAFAASGSGERILALMDAFRAEVYWAVYDRDGARLSGPQVGPLEAALAEAPAGAAFVGDAVAKARGRIEADVASALFPQVELHLAAVLGRAALDRLAAGDTIAASELRPLYLRGADARVSRP